MACFLYDHYHFVSACENSSRLATARDPGFLRAPTSRVAGDPPPHRQPSHPLPFPALISLCPHPLHPSPRREHAAGGESRLLLEPSHPSHRRRSVRSSHPSASFPVGTRRREQTVAPSHTPPHLLAHSTALTRALRRLVPRTTASQQRARDHDAPKNANLSGLHVTVPALFKSSFTASTPRDARRRVSTVRHPLGCANPAFVSCVPRA